MSILDTFLFIFEADASKIKQGTDAAKKGADDVKKGMVDADAAASMLGKSLKEVAIGAAAAIGAMFTVDYVMGMISQQAEFADRLSKTAQMLDANVSDLHAWGEAVARAGGSVEGFSETLKGVQSGLAMVATTGHSRAKPFFDQLGISMLDASGKARNVMDLLPEIAAKIEGMSKADSTGLLRKMGFDDGTILLLQQGRKAVDDLVARQRALGVVTKEDAEIAERFNDQLDDTRQMLNHIYMVIGTTILPAFTWMLEKFEAVFMAVREHSDSFAVLGKGLLIVAGIVTAIYLPAMASAAVATLAATWPILAVAAAIAALVLAVDDVVTYLDGGKSVIGGFIEKWPLLGEYVEIVATQMQFFWDVLKALFGFIADVFSVGVSAAFDNLKSSIVGAVDRVLEKFPSLRSALVSLRDFMSDVVAGMIAGFQKFIDVLMIIPNMIGNVLKGAGKVLGMLGIGTLIGAAPVAAMPADVQAGLANGKTAIAQANTPLAAQTSTSLAGPRSVSNTNSVNVDKVEVHTQATDADGISQAIGDSLDTHLRQTLDQASDGVAG